MNANLKWVGIGLIAVLLGLIGSGLHFVLPRHEVVRVTGVEVKRMDGDGVVNAKNPADGPTRDVYFVAVKHPDSGKIMVFRNEDTGWGFPWYFKFDSADVQAIAQDLARDTDQLALVKYYGWRVNLLSWFPNVVKVVKTDSRDEPFPWFNVLFFVLLAGAIGYPAYRVKRFVDERNGAQVIRNNELG